MKPSVSLPPLAAFLILCVACSNMYYAAWEKLGKEKRDLLRDNVKAAKTDQTKAQEEFKDALTQLKELTNFKGGDLEAKYNSLQSEYNQCVRRSDAVTGRIKKIDEIAADLFAEWQKEAGSMQNADLRRKSEAKLGATKARFAQLEKTMKSAERRLEPTLKQFRDQVLYLKHNLNAQAIAGLQSEVGSIELDVAALIKDMDKSIAEGDAFIKGMPE